MDIAFMKRIGIRCNIIPVIAKSDSLTPEEIIKFKKSVKLLMTKRL
jgi:cell division control protein 12